VALDQVEVMEQLGYRQFMVAGHDRGARTGARPCLDHPQRVERAAVVGILPNSATADPGSSFATMGRSWFCRTAGLQPASSWPQR
jgi:haloacetate dehalogenase